MSTTNQGPRATRSTGSETSTPPPAPSPAETWMLMASLVMDHRSTWRTFVAARTGMPFSRFRALRRLEPGPLTATRLAERLDIDAAATSVVVSDLVERGLVTKHADPSDGRRKIVTLTETGRDVLTDVRTHAEAPALIDALSDTERGDLHRLLTTMQEHTA